MVRENRLGCVVMVRENKNKETLRSMKDFVIACCHDS
jgi:hypothetical protein